ALVGVLRRAETRELAHRPEPRPVHRRMDAARVRELARHRELTRRIEAREIVRGVEWLDRDLRERRELLLALGTLFHRRQVRLVQPALLGSPCRLERHAATNERAITMRCTSLVPSYSVVT